MSLVYNSQTPSIRWALSRLNENAGLINVNIDAIIGGSGSTAPNANLENAVKWAIAKANTGAVQYSQSNRNLGNPNAWSYDCSSFILTALQYAGFSTGGATTTRDMVSKLTANGWVWHTSGGARIPASNLQRGDILIVQFGANGHTQMYIGNNQDVNCGGTPANIVTHQDTNWGRGAWDGFLRYGA